MYAEWVSVVASRGGLLYTPRGLTDRVQASIGVVYQFEDRQICGVRGATDEPE